MTGVTKSNQTDLIPEELRESLVFSKEDQNKVFERLHNRPVPHFTKYRMKRRFSFITVASILLLSLATLSTMKSPAIAEKVVEIPKILSIFNPSSNEINVGEELKKQGYHVAGGDFLPSMDDITITIYGSENYFLEVDDKVSAEAKKILAAKGHKGIGVNLSRRAKTPKQDEVAEMKMAMQEKVDKEIAGLLKEKGYIFTGIQGNPFANIILVKVPKTETKVAMLEKDLKEILKSKDMESWKIEMDQIKINQEMLVPIDELFYAKKELKVTNVSTGFINDSFYYWIRTSLESSSQDSKVTAKKIEEEMEKLFNKEEIRPLLGDTPYKIVVESIDEKKIN